MKINPPYLLCVKHGKQRGYLLCNHIKEAYLQNCKLEPKVQIPPNIDKRSMGLVMCSSETTNHTFGFTPTCEQCLLANDLLALSVIEGKARVHEEELAGMDHWAKTIQYEQANKVH